MYLLLIYWAFLAAGYFAGNRMKKAGRDAGAFGALMMLTVYGLCFCMGMRMGVNEQVTSNLGTIGLEALIITFACIAGSILAVFLLRKILGMDRFGELSRAKAGQTDAGRMENIQTANGQPDAGPAKNIQTANGHQAPEPAKNIQTKTGQTGTSGIPADGDGSGSAGTDLRSTVILLSVVAAGMILGAFVLARRGEDFLGRFDSGSSLAMIILLCILMTLVGLDMGHSGTVIDSMRKAGLRILLFPLASMIGTMAFGICACLLFGFTMRESAAIPIGFGWYSYAPVVIAGAGSQYIVASAVSFMHNVIREVAGIILIPAASARIGYLEATTIPGIAAMDVCIPIVNRACGPDTVVYSFSIGVVMCAVTSVGVPLIMGV